MAGFEVTLYGRIWVTPKEENRRIEEIDHWIVEKDIPFSVFYQLRPNRFDWKIVFPHPERKRKR
jgi:hypothetical protein